MKKFYKGHVYYRLLVDAMYIALIFFVIFVNLADSGLILEPSIYLIGFAIVYALKTAYNIIYMNMSFYELREKDIRCKRGVLFKKESILEYTKINAINKKQNILHKFFQVAILTVDSGSANTASRAEIVILERVDVVDKLKSMLTSYQKGGKAVSGTQASSQIDKATPYRKQEENLYKFTSKLKFIYSIIDVFTAVIVIAVIICAIAGSMMLLGSIKSSGEPLLAMTVLASEVLITGLMFALVVALITFISSVLQYAFRYYDFNLQRTENGLEVSYGLFTRSTNTFAYSKIKAVKITQTLLQRLFGYASVNVEVVGYVEDSQSNNNRNAIPSGMLIPLYKKSELDEFLAQILPQFAPQKPMHGPTSFIPFITWKLFFGIVPLTLAYLTWVWFLNNTGAPEGFVKSALVGLIPLDLFIAILVLVHGALERKNTAVAITDNTLILYGGGLTKKCLIIPKKNIIGLESITTPLREKAGIYSYKIHFYSNHLTNSYTVKNLDQPLNQKLLECVND